MLFASFRLHGDLNDFLPAEQRHTVIVVALNGQPAVKHPLEALGVPHPEIEVVLANGQAVDLAYRVQPDDQIEVYPLTSGVPATVRLRPPLVRPLCFVLDTHLGQLATYLRLLGFDTLYRNDYEDAELAQIASAGERVLLTRDRGLLKRKLVVHGYCVRASDPRRQVMDVLRRYGLADAICPWRRCLRCNGLLEFAAKEVIFDRLQPKTQLYYEDFQRCQGCGQIYWQGSHHARMAAFVGEIQRALVVNAD